MMHTSSAYCIWIIAQISRTYVFRQLHTHATVYVKDSTRNMRYVHNTLHNTLGTTPVYTTQNVRKQHDTWHNMKAHHMRTQHAHNTCAQNMRTTHTTHAHTRTKHAHRCAHNTRAHTLWLGRKVMVVVVGEKHFFEEEYEEKTSRGEEESQRELWRDFRQDFLRQDY